MSINSIGFVGTGAITEAMVRGLLATTPYAAEVHLSPRSADIAARLTEDFPSARVAKDNQAVVDLSDIVFLAIRPQIAKEVIDAKGPGPTRGNPRPEVRAPEDTQRSTCAAPWASRAKPPSA